MVAMIAPTPDGQLTPVGNHPELGRFYEFDPNRIMPDPENPRKTFRKIPQLAASITALGQELPGQVTLLSDNPDFDAMLVDGERRLRACRRAGVKFHAIIVTKVLSPADRLTKALAVNFNQERHDHMEIAMSLQRIQELRRAEGIELTQKQLGAIFGKSAFWVNSHLSLLNLTPLVQELMKSPEDKQAAQEATVGAGEKVQRTAYLKFDNARMLAKLEPRLQEKLALHIVKEDMPHTTARRYIVKQTGKAGVRHQIRDAHPAEAAELFGNKVQTALAYIGMYADLDFERLKKIFSGSSVPEMVAHNQLLSDLNENVVGLMESLRLVMRKKREAAVGAACTGRTNE